MKLVVKIAAGIILAALIRYGIAVFAMREAAHEAQVQIAAITEQANAQAQRQREKLEAARRANEAARLAALAQQRQQAEQLAMAARAEAQAAVDKQAAWDAYYKAPAKCHNASDWATQVECGNHFMREKKKFDAGYRPR